MKQLYQISLVGLLLMSLIMSVWWQVRAAVSLPVATDVPIYREGLEPGWENWSWDVTLLDFFSTTVVYTGSYAIAVDLAHDGSLSLRRGDFTAVPYQLLSFSLHGGPIGGQQLQLFLHAEGGEPLSPITITDYISGGVVLSDTWHHIAIPLADLGVSDTMSRVTIQGIGDQPLFYVDELIIIAGPQRPFTITVSPNTVLQPISQTMFGTNAAMWDGNIHENPDVITRVAAANVSVMRFPGGITSDNYHWQEYEPGTPSNAWSLNTTEFISFTRQTSTAPMITTNFGTGTAQEAADWVHFTNISHTWGVEYWEVGNEIYGSWEPSWTHDAAEYILGDETHDGFNDYCAAMKAVDPTIKVGMVGTATPWEYNNWAPTVLQLVSDCVDYYVVHYYPIGPGEVDYGRLLARSTHNWPLIGDDLRQMLATYASHLDLEIAVTEYNSYWAAPEVLAEQTVNMLFLADTIGQMMTQGVSAANHWDILNGAAPPDTRYGFVVPGTYFRRPSYYVYPLWRMAGDKLVLSTHNLDPYVEMAVYATHDADRGALTLLVVNKTETLSGSIHLQNFLPGHEVEIFVAQGETLMDTSVAYNGDENPPPDLAVPPITMTITGPTFAYSFPPYSVTSMTIYGEVLSPMETHKLLYLPNIVAALPKQLGN